MAAACVALAPGAGYAVTKPVQITASKFDPPVVVVAPRTEVEWTNGDSRTHALSGDFQSPDIAPGAKFTRIFPRIGSFDYQDRDNPAITGTVIVAASVGGRPRYPRPGGSGLVEHHWRVTLHYEVSESWKYWDGARPSFEGPCNAQVGAGSRAVTFHASFPDVRYQRFGRQEVGLSGKSKPYGIPRYREVIDSKDQGPDPGPSVDCGDGSTGFPPNVEQRCDHNYAGTRVRADLLWLPQPPYGELTFPHAYVGRRPPVPANCGHGLHQGFPSLDASLLPWDPGGGGIHNLMYDNGKTDRLTRAEVGALRAGRAVTITRSFGVRFTKDCCLPWNTYSSGGRTNVGAQHVASGKVTIRFVPR